MKNTEPVNFENVYVSTHGHVYCKSEDLMISSDSQPTYNPDACIWNAFDEGDRGWAGFQTKEFDNGHFTFAINSSKGRQKIMTPSIKIGTKNYPLPHFISGPKERPLFTFGEIKAMVNQSIFLEYFDETFNVSTIKIQTLDNQIAWHYKELTDPIVFKQMKDYYANEKKFYLNVSPTGNDSKTTIVFTLDSEDELYRKATQEFTWGKHIFTIKNPFLALTKKELTDLMENKQMKTYLGNPINKITGIKFLYPNETIRYFGKASNYDLKAMVKEQDLLRSG